MWERTREFSTPREAWPKVLCQEGPHQVQVARDQQPREQRSMGSEVAARESGARPLGPSLIRHIEEISPDPESREESLKGSKQGRCGTFVF